MPKYRAILQYLGTRYAGWQLQTDQPTIQGALREATLRVAGEEVVWTGAGRTDAGVHARGQCAHFRLSQPREVDRLLRALNGVLPQDIRVWRLGPAADSFHARRDALRKQYEYRIHQGPVLPPFLLGLAYHCYRRLDVEAMARAAGFLRGYWDFSGFAASGSSVRTHTRTVFESHFVRRGELLIYRVEADGFLQHMVRNIVGTLLEVGAGRRAAEDLFRVLASRDRRNAGRTAQPQGLYLNRVWYRRRSS